MTTTTDHSLSMDSPGVTTEHNRDSSPEFNSATFTLLRSIPEAPVECQVCVVGAGPAGLMLAANLTRFGVKIEIVDERSDPTPVGRYAQPY
jgi:phenol 2-monooxygenase